MFNLSYAYFHLVPGFRMLAQVTIYRRLSIGQDDHLDQSEAYYIS